MQRLVVECRSDADDADPEGCSLLMMAARSGRADMVEILILYAPGFGGRLPSSSLASLPPLEFLLGLRALDVSRREV